MTTSKPASVNLKRKIKWAGKWSFVPVAKKKDHYLPDHVLVGGVATKVTEGTFYLEWYEGKKRVQKAVGRNGHEAIAARKTQSEIHALRSSGVKVEDNAPQLTPGRESLKEAAKGYLYDTRAQHRPKTLAKYREALASFAAFTPKQYLDDLLADDIREFLAHMQIEQGLAPKTALVKGVIVHGVLTGLGATLPMKKGDWPKVTKKTSRPMYRTDTLKRLLASVNREHYITYSFLLHTGFREQEATFCSWPDINWQRGEISVTEKPHLGFQIKNYERRTIPVVEELMELLREHRKTLPEDAFLVFPTRAAKGRAALIRPGGKNRLDLLDLLKLDYFRAGLNCGECRVTSKGKPTTCATVPQCKKCGLHIFRHTYATNNLRAGVSLPDVSRLLGHKDVATTQIYLHSMENDDLREQVLKTDLGTMYVPDEFRPVEHKRIHVISDESRKKIAEGGRRGGQRRLATV